MFILVVDDEIESCDIMERMLTNGGHKVLCTRRGEDALRLVEQTNANLVILDVVLPDLCGLQVCEQVRALYQIPIIMVSALACSATDMAHGLSCGADAYIIKPIAYNLLMAQIDAVLRRFSQLTGFEQATPCYNDGYLLIDLSNCQVRIKGKHVHLSDLEYQLLALLVRNTNQIVPALEILECLWAGQSHEDTASLRAYIKRLRASIEPDPQHPQYIVNEHGVGYRFVSS